MLVRYCRRSGTASSMKRRCSKIGSPRAAAAGELGRETSISTRGCIVVWVDRETPCTHGDDHEELANTHCCGAAPRRCLGGPVLRRTHFHRGGPAADASS